MPRIGVITGLKSEIAALAPYWPSARFVAAGGGAARAEEAARAMAAEGVDALVSIGLAGFPNERVTSADSFVALADQALYRAKNEGRNLVRE